MLRGIKRFLPSPFVNNDEEIVEYAVKPLLAQSGPLDDIDVALRLIYALGKMDKWLYADITHFPQFYQYLNEQDNIPGFADDITGFCQQRQQYHPQRDPLWCAGVDEVC